MTSFLEFLCEEPWWVLVVGLPLAYVLFVVWAVFL